jgi:hypothetical protein
MMILDPKRSEKFRRAVYEQNKLRAQSFKRKGYTEDRELMHVLRIPRIWLLQDTDLLLMQRAEHEGDLKRRDMYMKRFLERHPECDLTRMT